MAKEDEWFVETLDSFTSKNLSQELDFADYQKTFIQIKEKGRMIGLVVWPLPSHKEVMVIERSKKDTGYRYRIFRRRGGTGTLAEEWTFDRKNAKEAVGTLKRLREIQEKKREEASDGIQQGKRR